MTRDFKFYDSGYASELNASTPITKPPASYIFTPVYRIEIPNVKAGDLIDASAYGQVTNNNGVISNPTGTNVMAAFGIWLGAAAGAETTKLTRPNGTNVDRLIHHLPVRSAGCWVAPQDYPVLVVAAYIYSASSIAQPGWMLTIDEGYGALQIKHWFTPAAIAAE